MVKYNYVKVLLILGLFLIPVDSFSIDRMPLDVIRESNTAILTIYQSSPVVSERLLAEIMLVMDKVTDFRTMADRAVQQVCAKNPDKLCTSLKDEFIKLLKLTATRKLGRYRADRFIYHDEKVTAVGAVVKSTAHFQEDSVQLDYILEKKDGKWLVVNYIADDVDTIQNYRSQFRRIVRKNSVEFLVKRLKKKNDQYEKERKIKEKV